MFIDFFVYPGCRFTCYNLTYPVPALTTVVEPATSTLDVKVPAVDVSCTRA